MDKIILKRATVYGGGQKKAKKLSPSKIWGVRFACQLPGAQAVVLCQMNLKGISTMLQYHIKYNSGTIIELGVPIVDH